MTIASKPGLHDSVLKLLSVPSYIMGGHITQNCAMRERTVQVCVCVCVCVYVVVLRMPYITIA